MDFRIGEKFINSHKKEIIRIFQVYQMIEVLLFMNLYFPDKNETPQTLTWKFNKKTLGKLKNRYDSKYPKDDYKISNLLETVAKQRNDFMHSIWINFLLMKEKDTQQYGDLIFKDYELNANELFEKITAFSKL